MRKLASIQKIEKLEPIPKADFIEKATILGWELVVKKGEFQEGDLAVYIEIDSIVPDIQIFEFMQQRKFRVRTIKLRKQISQGLALPILLFFPLNANLKVGDDVTKELNIKKYDPELQKEMNKQANSPKHPIIKYLFKYKWFRSTYKFFVPPKTGPFPTHLISKTNEERIQSIPDFFKDNPDIKMYVTEKLDGCSATYINHKGKFYVCSRNIHLIKEDGRHWWEIVRKYNLKDTIPEGTAIQGEIVGPGIQKNKYKLSHIDFYMFNVVDITNKHRHNLDVMKGIAQVLNLKTIPIIDENFSFLESTTVNDIIKLTKRKSALNIKTKIEGLVFRSLDSKLSFKAINPEFLLQYENEE
jgi:hypothetical protein